MNIDALIKPLSIEEIDFRVQSVNNGGYATILAYKDARADMIRLDEAAGPLGWKREHTNGNANCTVSLWDNETKQWVSKEDTGSESNAEANKGLASDSFKRACFNWGIGRELYDYPVISVKLFENEITEKNGRKTANWNLKLKEWTWFSQFKNGKITYLAAKDQNGKKRFVWGEFDKELQEQTAKGIKSDSSPTEDPTTRGTSDEEEKGNATALMKKAAGPIEDEKPTEEQETKQPTEEEIKWNELAQKYEIMFGKKPRANTKLETLEQKIAEETERRVAEQSSFDGTASDTQGAIYSASGEESEEEESEDESANDAYAEDETTMTEEQLQAVEESAEVEEVKAEEVDVLTSYMEQIDDYNDRGSFVKWAKSAVSAITGVVDAEGIKKFQDACNVHYSKIA
jgi:hypothetical protein